MDFSRKTTVDSFTMPIIPRYCETDQSGVVHHTVYPIWFEMGRTELLRANGFAYNDLEKAGTFFVAVDLSVRYRRPALYDQQLELTTTCTNITATRVEHSYSLIQKDTALLLVEGKTTLTCVDAEGKLRRMPEFMYPADENEVSKAKNTKKDAFNTPDDMLSTSQP